MINDTTTLPVPLAAGGTRVSTVAQLADIPEEDIWLAKQKSARTRRAYRLDVQHFMRTLGIADRDELRQADHKAVIAWERYPREVEHAAASTIRRRLAALSATAAALLLTHIALSAAEAPEPNYIVALGASGIHGKGVPLGEAYPAQLETMLRAAGFNVRVINAGVDGDTTARMLMRMDSVITAGTKVTILQPGTNDFRNKRSLSVDQHLANVEAIVRRLSAQRIRVVICSSDAAEAALARRYDAIAMPCADRAHLIDGEHLDPTGHRNVAEQLLPVIEGMLRQRP